MPVYNPNIPQPTDLVSQSQSQILGNFGSLQYVPNGIVQFPDNMGIPAQNALTQIFSQRSTLSGKLELFMQRPTGNTEFPTTVEFTSYGYNGSITYTINDGANNLTGTHGWTRLPSGILLKFGLVGTTPGVGLPLGAGATVTFPTSSSIPAFAGGPYVIIGEATFATLNTDPGTNVNIVPVNTLTFNVFPSLRYPTSPATFAQFAFLAIGF